MQLEVWWIFPLNIWKTSPRWEECLTLTSTWHEHPNSIAHTQIHPVPLFSVLQNTCYIKSLETIQMCSLKAKVSPHLYCMYECSWIYHRVQIHCTQHSLTYKDVFAPCRDKSAFLWLDKNNSGENWTILYGNVVCWSRSKCEYMYQPVCVEMLGHCGICLIQLLYSDQPLTYEYLWCVPFVVTVDAPTLDIRKHYKDRCCTLWVGFSAVWILLRYSVAPSGFSVALWRRCPREQRSYWRITLCTWVVLFIALVFGE